MKIKKPVPKPLGLFLKYSIYFLIIIKTTVVSYFTLKLQSLISHNLLKKYFYLLFEVKS